MNLFSYLMAFLYTAMMVTIGMVVVVGFPPIFDFADVVHLMASAGVMLWMAGRMWVNRYKTPRWAVYSVGFIGSMFYLILIDFGVTLMRVLGLLWLGFDYYLDYVLVTSFPLLPVLLLGSRFRLFWIYQVRSIRA